MQQFKIKQGGFNEIRRMMIIRFIPMLIMLMVVVILINYYGPNADPETDVLPIALPIFLAAMAAGVYISIKRTKAQLDSYVITISENSITREQLYTPTISLYFNEIKEIVKQKNGSFTIKGSDANNPIGIFAQVENYEQLEASLNAILPITTTSKVSLLQGYQGLTGFATLGLMLALYTSQNKIIVVCSGVLISAGMIWSMIVIQKSKNLDNRIKKLSWVSILVLIQAIVITIYKVAGYSGTH